jgi:Zn-finger in ubiquitin-hydrolases and other protein.
MYAKAPYTVIQRAMHIHPTVSEFIPTMMDRLKPLQRSGGAEPRQEEIREDPMKSERDGINPAAEPSGTGCVECLALGGWWFHLRRCAECGHIGCCDSSPNQHASKHYALRVTR